jgi:hypothetical protein
MPDVHAIVNHTKITQKTIWRFHLDTEKERNLWMTEAYPKIKLFCQKLGYEFQVVDMRWGVRNESVDEHNGTEMCLREVQQCQRLSTGPNFVVSTLIKSFICDKVVKFHA